MQKGRPVKQYMVEYRIGKDWIIGFEKLINDKYNQGWEYVEIRSLSVNEYRIVYKKINTPSSLQEFTKDFERMVQSQAKK